MLSKAEKLFCRSLYIRVRKNVFISFLHSAWTREGERIKQSKFTDLQDPILEYVLNASLLGSVSSLFTSQGHRARQLLQLVSRVFVQLGDLRRGSEKDLRSVVDGPRPKVQDIILAVSACDSQLNYRVTIQFVQNLPLTLM